MHIGKSTPLETVGAARLHWEFDSPPFRFWGCISTGEWLNGIQPMAVRFRSAPLRKATRASSNGRPLVRLTGDDGSIPSARTGSSSKGKIPRFAREGCGFDSRRLHRLVEQVGSSPEKRRLDPGEGLPRPATRFLGAGCRKGLRMHRAAAERFPLGSEFPKWPALRGTVRVRIPSRRQQTRRCGRLAKAPAW